ncbi:MAG: response regulator transcription factor [Bdellovibrionales bacterium]|nr:response regulator transcription factor [Bdellovibrionales bacterium]
MKTVMVVEDEFTMRSFLSASLTAKGYLVVESSDFVEATQSLKARKVDVLLLDTDLTDRSFEQHFVAFRKAYPNLPVLALTIGEGELSKADLLKMGMDDFLSKPFGFSDLLMRIERILSQPSTECLLSGTRNLRVDIPGKRVSLGETAVTLSELEWKCIQILCERIGKVVDESVLSQLVVSSVGVGDPRLLVKLIIWQLRQKLEEDPLQPQMIKTVSGIGYRLESFS